MHTPDFFRLLKVIHTAFLFIHLHRLSRRVRFCSRGFRFFLPSRPFRSSQTKISQVLLQVYNLAPLATLGRGGYTGRAREPKHPPLVHIVFVIVYHGSVLSRFF